MAATVPLPAIITQIDQKEFSINEKTSITEKLKMRSVAQQARKKILVGGRGKIVLSVGQSLK